MKRKLIGCGVVFVAITVTILAIFFSSGKRMVSRIEAATDEADSVVLERYHFGEVINRSTITPQELKDWISRDLKSRPPLRFDISFCWKPHHRIILQSEEISREIQICFECNLFKFESSQRPIPVSWKTEFRSLFSDHGIPATTPDYEEFEAIQKRRAEKDSGGHPPIHDASTAE